jgi:cytochrome c5
MQRWMKSVAGGAVASGDGERIARAFDSIGAHAPPGMRNWAGSSAAGAAKARADDIDCAKQECKRCHDANLRSYRASRRDAAWP